MRHVLLLAVLVAACAQADFEPGRSLVIADKDAYLLLPSEVVAGPDVRQIQWSPDGRYALLWRVAPANPSLIVDLALGKDASAERARGMTQILAVDARTGRSALALEVPVLDLQVTAIEWFAGAPSALVTATVRSDRKDYESGLIAVDALRGTAKEILRSSGNFKVTLSPKEPTAVLTEDVVGSTGRLTGQSVSRLISPDGSLGAPVRLPGRFPAVFWASNGGWACRERESTSAMGYLIDYSTGTTKQIAGLTHYEQSASRPALKIVEAVHSTVLGGVRTPVHVSLLAPAVTPSLPGDRSVVLSTDASLSSLSPTGDSLICCVQGAAFIRRIVRIPREAAIVASRNSQVSSAVRSCRDCALAALQLADDSDDTLPAPDSFAGKAAKYLRDRTLLESFTYTFVGGSIRDLAKPEEMPIGYVVGPGGRAIAFADGHVRWYPDS